MQHLYLTNKEGGKKLNFSFYASPLFLDPFLAFVDLESLFAGIEMSMMWQHEEFVEPGWPFFVHFVTKVDINFSCVCDIRT